MECRKEAALRVEVPGVDFTEMAREAIAANLLKSLVGNEDIVEKIVASAIAQKVNDKGAVSDRSYENKTPYVEWLVGDMIRGVTRDVLKQKVEEMRPHLEKAIHAQLKRSISSAAKALAQCFVNSVGNSYRVNVGIDLKFQGE